MEEEIKVEIEIPKEKRIKSEITRLTKLFKGTTVSQRAMVKTLIENAAFMAASLEDLRKIINENGYTEEYKNGQNQSGVKRRNEVEIYNVMIKNYVAAIKLMADVMPESGPEADKLIGFITGKKSGSSGKAAKKS